MSAPEHHPLCFKDGCLGVDGCCCLAAYWRGCEDADAQRGNERFSADWHAEFRCLENALRAFPNPIVIPKERA